MENAVAKREEMQISIEDIKKYIAPNATDKELFMFMGVAKSYGLNPMKREIHFVKYGNNPAQVIVGYESYIKRAERTGVLDGWKVWIENVGKTDEKAVIEIRRKDFSEPIKWEVYRTEFDKGQANWKTMPLFMLRKVAIAQGFRLAFSEEVGGMPYIPEEMPLEKGGGTSEALRKDTIDIAPQEENPHETKRYDLHPGEPKDVHEVLGEEKPDEEKLIKFKWEQLNAKMLGFRKEQKEKFFAFVLQGRPRSVDILQDFLDNYMEYRTKFMDSKEKA